jgi:hypothetical protein
MEKCLVCAHEFARKGNVCPNCHWPINFASMTRDSRTDAYVVNWAAHMYKQLIEIHDQKQEVSVKDPAEILDISVLEARVQQLTAELHSLNSTYIQDRHRNNRKLEDIAKELEFFKEIIQKDREEIAKIPGLERQYHEISQFIVVPQSQPGSLALVLETPTTIDPPAIIRERPISLPVFESILEPVPAVLPDVKIPISPAERDLLDLYNRSAEIPEIIRQGAIDVSIDLDALNRLRDGDVSPVTFVVDRKGNFLVVRRGGYHYLVPNKKRPINSHIHKTVKSIYTCEGYYENYEQFALVRPALVEEVIGVSADSRSDHRWQLGQKGILKFK